nr:MAG TPA: hypothetical protein [Caudoviricetes sp.]
MGCLLSAYNYIMPHITQYVNWQNKFYLTLLCSAAHV